MQVQSINNQNNNLSMQALFFPKEPKASAVVSPEIRKAIKNNPFIQLLSTKANVLVRFNSFNDGIKMNHLRLDVFDKETNKEVASMLYSSRMYDFNGGRINLSETEFINHIEKPETTTKIVQKGNWFDRIFGRKKERVETLKKQTDYYNFTFLHTDDKYPLEGITPEIVEDLHNAEKQIRVINKELVASLSN